MTSDNVLDVSAAIQRISDAVDAWRERAETAELGLIEMECGVSPGPDDLPCLRVKGHRGDHLDAQGGSW